MVTVLSLVPSRIYYPSGVSEYIVVGPSRPGDGHRPGVPVRESTGRVHLRSPRDYHFPERFPEVLRQERVQYRVQARIGVRQTVADYLYDNADGRDLVVVDAFQHQYDLQRYRVYYDDHRYSGRCRRGRWWDNRTRNQTDIENYPIEFR